MRQCIFSSCKLRPDDRIGNVALIHRFPREEHIRKLWVDWIRNKCDLPTFEFNYKAGLCYRHFDRHCYHRSNGLLKPFSYPTFTPQDLDSSSIIGSSTKEISMNGVPKSNLIIKVDPTLVKNSTSKQSDGGKKLILLVTDHGNKASQTPKSNFSFISQMQPEANSVRHQDVPVPPLRFINKDRAASVSDDKSTAVIKNSFCSVKPQLPGGVTCLSPSSNVFTIQEEVCVSQDGFSSQCADDEQSLSPSTAECQPDRKSASGARSPPSRTSNVLQTVLNSSRRRIRVYRRRLQEEKKKMSRLEKLLDEMKEKQLISCGVAEKIEAILYDD